MLYINLEIYEDLTIKPQNNGVSIIDHVDPLSQPNPKRSNPQTLKP